MEQNNQTKWRTLYFRNHLPIRIKGEWDELWLGYVDRNFGSRDIRYYKNQKGEYLFWHRYTSPNTDGKSYSTFIGKFRPGTEDALDKFPLRCGGWIDDPDFISLSMEDRGKIQVLLDSLGLSKVEEF